MYLQTTLFCVLIVFFVDADFYKDMTYIKSCNESSPISLETMNQVLMYKQVDDHSSNNFKCFLFCLFNKYGWMDDHGDFKLHKIKTILEDVQLETTSLEYILLKCTAIDSFDKCERSLIFTQCFWKKAVQKPNDNQYLYNIMNEK